uniref:DEAD-box ATP-dependent RNA helicase 33 n=1 Tax=Cajanus cajan TaxID=3821 RepID=A0A151R744_CAJCA|nr:Putative DEAD-box ATP-dependent RNA helicase 33 [Cajanus cajan]
MGGGPRTYPGGVSKWQWKRMQERKAKQLLKARLGRERQIYEMRKRAELKAAVSELERPWEAVKREEAPNLFSVGADEQVKVLADRFQRPGGFDMWSERDGPMLFESPDELPSARFFPKGVVHSVKPYRRVDGYGLVKGGLLEGNDCGGGDDGECSSSDVSYGRNGVDGHGGLGRNVNGNGMRFLSDDFGKSSDGGRSDGERSSLSNYGRNGMGGDGGLRRNGNGRRVLSDNVDRSKDVEQSSRSNYGRNGVDGDGGLRRNKNGRRVLFDNVGRSSDGGRSSRLNYQRNGLNVDSRMRRDGNGIGSVRKQRGANSIGGRSRGKYTNRNSNYASPRGRGAKSEVYDMGLQQDGSYGFQQKHEQPDSANW